MITLTPTSLVRIVIKSCLRSNLGGKLSGEGKFQGGKHSGEILSRGEMVDIIITE